MLDEGVGGELIGTGLARLGGVLTADAPGALLLMEGANDLNQFGADGISPGVSGLQQMIRLARGRGIVVFVGTLLPERANGTPARASHPELVAPFNDAIKALAAAEGAMLVDLYRRVRRGRRYHADQQRRPAPDRGREPADCADLLRCGQDAPRNRQQLARRAGHAECGGTG